MNILLSINRGYLPHFYVTVHSICESNGEYGLHFYVMHNDLTPSDCETIAQSFPMASFSYIRMNETCLSRFPKVKRYPYTIYYRIFASEYLPKAMDRILYLDCDLVVHNDLKSFYESDFNGNIFIACSNIGKAMMAFNRLRLGLPKDYRYMNTGVMLINLAEYRIALDTEAIRKYTLANKWKLMLYDQDILCKFYGNRIKMEKTSVYNLSDRYISWHKKENITAEWVRKNNVIIHYIGKNKPWKPKYRGILAEYYLTNQEKVKNFAIAKTE